MIVNYMAEADQRTEREHLSLQFNGISRDLLHKFMNGNHVQREFQGKIHVEDSSTVEEEGEEIELSLGLSLNGRFGVDPKRTKKLVRSSSISSFLLNGDVNNARVVPIASYSPLTRTCSLPAEADDELRKRKELQSLRRMEAKKRRLDKLKVVRVLKDKVDLGEASDENANVCGNGWPSSQGSVGSQGSASSGASEFESQSVQGLNKNAEARSPSSVQCLTEQTEKKPVVAPQLVEGGASHLFSGAEKHNERKETIDSIMLNMPCVSTRGDGPNGKKVEGFLYRYRKGEEVRIVCVCHGSFLSPAEFVKHAGGGDVTHPLRHIVVSPPAFL